jgi:FtsZ-binding cell division protein ZapB
MPESETNVDRLEANLDKLVHTVAGLTVLVHEVTESQKHPITESQKDPNTQSQKDLNDRQKALREASEERLRRIEALNREAGDRLNALAQWIRNHPAA